jgi:hypothetical protein
MLSRRESLKLAGALGVVGLGAGSASSQSAAPTVKTPVGFAVPEGAADCHVHVIPNPAKFPFWPGRIYTPPVDTADDLLALQRALHMDHVVIVTPSVYGTDNSATLDAIRQLGLGRARGIAVIDDKTPAADLDAMTQAGVVGIRINLETAGISDPAASAKKLDAAVERLRGRPWMLQMYTRPPVIAALKDRLGSLDVPEPRRRRQGLCQDLRRLSRFACRARLRGRRATRAGADRG